MKHSRFLASKPVSGLLSLIIRLWFSTFRLEIQNEKKWIDYLENGGRILFCSWHQQFFPVINYMKKYKKYHPAAIVSQSNDGDIIASVAERFGWKAIRGSSSRGGIRAMVKMIRHLKTFGFGGHVLDGPRGPIGVVKPGVIAMAHSASSAIVPLSVNAENALRFNSWDRFFVPFPFSKVTITFGDPIIFPKTDSKALFEKQRLELEQLLRPGLQ